MIQRIVKLGLAHKIIVVVIILAVGEAGYLAYRKFFGSEDAARYVFAAVRKGTLIVSVSGSGQVSASNQVDIKPKVSGDIVSIGASNGQEVRAGHMIVRLDSRDAARAVRDAEANLTSARIALEKLIKPADALAILQADNALRQTKNNLAKLILVQRVGAEKLNEAKTSAESDLLIAYEDGFNAVADAFLDLPGVMTGLDDMLFDSTIDRGMDNITWYANRTEYGTPEYTKARQYQDDVRTSYERARTAYAKSFDEYKAVTRASPAARVEEIIITTYQTVKDIADAVKAADNYVDFIQNVMADKDFQIPAAVATHQSALDTHTGTIGAHLAKLLTVTKSITNAKDAIVSARRDIAEAVENDPRDLQAAEQAVKEREESLAKLKAGADALDIQSSQLTIVQRENSLRDAKEKLADYGVRAPFDGIIANLDATIGDSASSGGVLATLMTRRKLAEISLNEVDVAPIKTGQKATLEFDAIPGLSITGVVAEIDAAGTVAQGVVTYNVKVAFDTQDDRVKPGMSVSAFVITDTKADILLAPNGAIRTSGDSQYVETADTNERLDAQSAGTAGVVLQNPVLRRIVETGLANDDMTEIVTGLNDGDLVIVRTIQPSASAAQSSTQSAIRIPGLPGGGGGGGGGFRGGGFGR